MNLRRPIVLIIILLCVSGAGTHPGAAIAVSRSGIVYIVDTGAGVFAIEPGGRVVRSRFRNTPWPSLPGAEFRSAGVDPTIVLSSDFPVTIGSDGKFYYPDPTYGDRIRMVAIDPSGARSVRATLQWPRARTRRFPLLHGRSRTAEEPYLRGLAVAADGTVYVAASGCGAALRIDSKGHVKTVLRASPP